VLAPRCTHSSTEQARNPGGEIQRAYRFLGPQLDGATLVPSAAAPPDPSTMWQVRPYFTPAARPVKINTPSSTTTKPSAGSSQSYSGRFPDAAGKKEIPPMPAGVTSTDQEGSQHDGWQREES
jgi:hypothetical protein